MNIDVNTQNKKTMSRWTIDDLYDICCTMKRVIEENDELKLRNKKLKQELAEYHQRDIDFLNTNQHFIGETLKAIIDFEQE